MVQADPASRPQLAVSAAIFIVQAQHILWANNAAAALTGYDSPALTTMPFSDLIAPLWRTKSASELELLTEQGSLIWVELSRNPVEFNGSAAEFLTWINPTHSKRRTRYRSCRPAGGTD